MTSTDAILGIYITHDPFILKDSASKDNQLILW